MDTDGARGELAARLRRARAERRMTVTALERRAGLGHTTVSQALNGRTVPGEATLVALARALRVEAEPLLELRRAALAPRTPPPDPADAAFEERYRAYLVERYGSLTVVGLDLSRPEEGCWPLDAAYLSLELASPGPGGGLVDMHAMERGGLGWEPPATVVERAEQALAGRHRTVVRGLAGSGKTTLLQWLAVGAAQGTLPAQLGHLHGCVPFMLPLRTLVRRGTLPEPDGFLSASGCPFGGAQPSGWADRALSSGRGLLLVDGVDEVPRDQRERTGAWLKELLAAYPRGCYVVTTRPSAVPEGWLAAAGFGEVAVRPMSRADVAVFIGRWHAAARAGEGSAARRERLDGLEEGLKDAVRRQRDLGQLATTPLMCALLCALNRDRRGHLPHSRMELYGAALSMLLVRRDRERDIDAPEGVVLNEQQSVHLLQRLAQWLVRNGQTEMDHSTAVERAGAVLPGMPAVAAQGDAEAVLGHLVARSGLLRRPTEDTVDFVHRTFQDYLGAKAAVEERDFGMLVAHAHDDQWEDVLKMAVGHARPAEAGTLLRRLVARGDKAKRHRARLHLLAAACLAQAAELDPAVRAAVEERAGALVPPRTSEEAVELASVGPVILDLLPGPEDLDQEAAEAVVQTAALVGGDAALSALKGFRNAGRRVQRALAEWWERFDAEEYAKEILGALPGLGYASITSREQLGCAHMLPDTLHELRVRGDFTAEDIRSVARTAPLHSLTISENRVLRDLSFTASLDRLQVLNVYRCPGVDLSALAGLPLTFVGLSATDEGIDCTPLAGMSRLDALYLDAPLGCDDLHDLSAPDRLTYLGLGPFTWGTALHGISGFPMLVTLNLSAAPSPEEQSELADLPNLRHMTFRTGALPAPGAAPPLSQITHLTMFSPSPADIEAVPVLFPGLERLVLSHHSATETDLTPLPRLSSLTLRNADPVIGLERFPPEAVTIRPLPRSATPSVSRGPR